MAQGKTSRAGCCVSAVPHCRGQCHQIAIRSNLCPHKIHSKVAMGEFWLALFKSRTMCKIATLGFSLLCNSPPKYEFMLSYSKRILKTLKKTNTTKLTHFICMKDKGISRNVSMQMASPESNCSTHHTAPILETIQFTQPEPQILACFSCKIFFERTI